MTQTTFKRVPFNLELAKKIAKKEVKGRIVTMEGREVRIICWDKKPISDITYEQPIVVLATSDFGGERLYTCTEKGEENQPKYKKRYDLIIEIPTYYRDYSNFVPMKWQPCLVRNTYSDTWRMAVCRGKDAYGIPIFYSENYSDGSCHWVHFLPISKVTERLVNTKKSYEELIKELDENGKD